MTSTIDTVSAEVRRYVAAVGGDSGNVPKEFNAPAQFVVGGLRPGETVLRVVCTRNPRPDWTTAAGLAVLTDRGVLLAQEGPSGRRISLWDIVRVEAFDTEVAGCHYPALGLRRGPVQDQIIAAAVEGWSYERGSAELQSFSRAVQKASGQAKAKPRPLDDVHQASPTPAYGGAPSANQVTAYRGAAPVTGARRAQQRPKPHLIAGTFWALVTLGTLIATVQGHPAAIILSLLAAAYSVYLYRGGRIVFIFF